MGNSTNSNDGKSADLSNNTNLTSGLVITPTDTRFISEDTFSRAPLHPLSQRVPVAHGECKMTKESDTLEIVNAKHCVTIIVQDTKNGYTALACFDGSNVNASKTSIESCLNQFDIDAPLMIYYLYNNRTQNLIDATTWFNDAKHNIVHTETVELPRTNRDYTNIIYSPFMRSAFVKSGFVFNTGVVYQIEGFAYAAKESETIVKDILGILKEAGLAPHSVIIKNKD